MSAKKTERLQKQVEDRIGQYKLVVEYLSKKTSVDSIPLANRACIVDVLRQGGWKPVGELFTKGGKTLDLIEAGKLEFKEQYDRMCAEHLLATVKSLTEG
jgi:hypothetical protein